MQALLIPNQLLSPLRRTKQKSSKSIGRRVTQPKDSKMMSAARLFITLRRMALSSHALSLRTSVPGTLFQHSSIIRREESLQLIRAQV